MFLGREKEIAELEELYSSDKFEMIAIYGRRRVGKSSLIAHFIQNKSAIYFTAREADSARNIDIFSETLKVFSQSEDKLFFESWEKVFEKIAKIAQNKKLVFVIDEYPYLAAADRSISSILQKFCDNEFKNSNLMLILCGSSMSFMEEQVLGYQSPLYGRRTAQMKLLPFSYKDSALFVPNYSIFDKALVYGFGGGMPKYLELFDDNLSLEKNVIKNFLTTTGYLYEEPTNLLKQELREHAKYNLIIEAIANGASQMNTISTKTRIETSAVSHYIKNLISLGIIKKEHCVTEEKNKKKSIYRIADTMFVFWYKYVFANEFSIISGDSESLYKNEITPDLNNFMGNIFEKMCFDYIAQKNAENKFVFKIRNMGRWWGTNKNTKSQEEIDIIAINDKEKSIAFCECKFTNSLVDISILRDLQRKSQVFENYYKKKYFVLFSKNGFDKNLQEEAKKNEPVILVELKDMF